MTLNATRPKNHLTDAMERRVLEGIVSAGVRGRMPEVSAELCDALEQMFPPVCYMGQGTLEDHLIYAGKVELVAILRAHQKEQFSGDDEEHV